MIKPSKASQGKARGETAKAGPFANPLDFIAEDHRREREVCALIDKLVENRPVKAEERRMMCTFLNEQLPQHLADEEIDLFPLMLKRCHPEEEIEKVIDKLTSDHGHAIADAPDVAAVIATRAQRGKRLSKDARARLTSFATHARRHLILENAIILPIARARLKKNDLNRMRTHMIERRTLDASPETKDAK